MKKDKIVTIFAWHRIYPVSSGHALRVINIAKMLSTEFEVVIVAINHKKDALFIEQTVVVDGVRIEQRDFSPIYPRWFYKVSCLLNGYPLFFPREVKKHINAMAEKSSIIQIESPRMYKLFNKRDFFVLDQHNVEWERIDFGRSIKNMFGKLIRRSAKRFEIEIIKKSKLVLATSERDKALLENECGNDTIVVIPNCIDKNHYEPNGNLSDKLEYPAKILYMGNLDYYPNRDAVDLILEFIAPACPMNTFIIAGRGYESARKMNVPSNVEFTGFVDDINKCISSADICICPLRFGSGTRLKLLEYMIFSKPIITTAKGAEGLDVVHEEHLIIEDNIEQYSMWIKEIEENNKMRKKIKENARNKVIESYDWRIYSEEICGKYRSLFDTCCEK